MDSRVETIKLVFGSMTSFFIAVFGSNYKLIVLLLIAMAFDTLTGHLRAIHEREWTSYSARWGLVGKLIELVLIMLMYICEWTFEITWLVNIVVTYFVICEVASIIENIVNGNLNENVPKEIVEILSKVKNNFVSVLIKKIKDFFGGGDDASK